jgi:cation/acetate symporter
MQYFLMIPNLIFGKAIGITAGVMARKIGADTWFSMTIGFVGIWLFSILDRSPNAAKERAAFPAQQVRSETGYGASGASGH